MEVDLPLLGRLFSSARGVAATERARPFEIDNAHCGEAVGVELVAAVRRRHFVRHYLQADGAIFIDPLAFRRAAIFGRSTFGHVESRFSCWVFFQDPKPLTQSKKNQRRLLRLFL